MAEADQGHGLPSGHLLEGRYRIDGVLGEGGFGITYLALDVRLEREVALKEYLPARFAVREGSSVRARSSVREDFEWGLRRFLEEARTLARFRHPNVVRVVDHFEANGTAHIVMDYEDGEPLDALLERGTPTEAQLMRVLLPVVDGLKQVHAAGFLHRDVKPANVFVRRSDETPVLLDFGSARQAVGRRSASLSAVVSAGYAPPEQYESDGDQGPWTDVYALSALCYRAIAGEAPVEAPRRQGALLRGRIDPLPSLAESAPAGYSASLLEAVDWGLRVIETERPQTLEEWEQALVENASKGREAARPVGSEDRSKSGPTAGAEDRSGPQPTQRQQREVGLGADGSLHSPAPCIDPNPPRCRNSPVSPHHWPRGFRVWLCFGLHCLGGFVGVCGRDMGGGGRLDIGGGRGGRVHAWSRGIRGLVECRLCFRVGAACRRPRDTRAPQTRWGQGCDVGASHCRHPALLRFLLPILPGFEVVANLTARQAYFSRPRRGPP